jgi:hypothetical protein
MAAWSPTAEGFRAIFRRPVFSLAEVAWRWSFGVAGVGLCTLSLLAYLDTLPVSGTDLALLRTRYPVLVGHALSHILRGSAARFVVAGVLLAAGLAVLWISLASLGRMAILKSLVAYMRGRARQASTYADAPLGLDPIEKPCRVRSLVGLNFLRAALMLTALASLAGAALVSRAISPESIPGLAFFLFLPLAILTAFFWWSLNWFLSIASVFVVREGQDTFTALSSAVQLCRERLGPVTALGTWFGLAHVILFVIATGAVIFSFSLAALVSPGLVLAGVLMLTLAYFALADTLYLGRLAGYVAILEAPVSLVPTTFEPGGPQSGLGMDPANSRVDQDELIFSDRVSSTVADSAASSQPSGVNLQPVPVDQDELILGDPELGSSDPLRQERLKP